MADYNAKVMSLLGTDVVPEGTINRSNTYEQLYTVSGRQIICPPETLNVVSTDSFCETLKFRIPRFWDGNDLAKHTGKILFINAAGESDEQQILEAEVTDTTISFEWCLCSRVTKQAGSVNFAIRFETIDTEEEEILFRWTTLPCTLTIVAGLTWTDGEIAATYPSILEQWLQNMSDIEANVNDLMINAGNKIAESNSATAAATEAAEAANTAALNANNATEAANNAATNINAAVEAANNAVEAANNAVETANTAASNANKEIFAVSLVKDSANTAAEAATEAAEAANTAVEAVNTAVEAANLATAKANDAGEYPLLYAGEILELGIGDTFKKNQIWRVKETYANNQGIRAGLYVCKVNYVHTDESKTFLDLLGDYTFSFMLDEGKGDTPVIGVDYYTAEQQAALAEEIANLVLTDVNIQLDNINGESGDKSETVFTVDTTATDYTGKTWIIGKSIGLDDEVDISCTGSLGSMAYHENGTIILPEILVVNGEDVNVKGALITKLDFDSGTITLELDGITYNVIAEKQDYADYE